MEEPIASVDRRVDLRARLKVAPSFRSVARVHLAVGLRAGVALEAMLLPQLEAVRRDVAVLEKPAR